MTTTTTQVLFRRGSTSENNALAGGTGEITVDLSTHQIRIHDGVGTLGGFTGALVSNVNSSIDTLSGILGGYLNNSGQNLYNYIVGGDTNLSGNLTQTGITLRSLVFAGDSNTSGSIALSGSNLYNYTIGGDTNLSGKLQTTGSNLYNLIIGLSGVENTTFNNVVYKTGNQLITGSKTFINTTSFGNIISTGSSSCVNILVGDLDINSTILDGIYNSSNDFFVDLNSGILGINTSIITVDWQNRILSGNWNAQTLQVNNSLSITGSLNIQPVSLSGSIINLGSNSFYIHTGYSSNDIFKLPTLSSSIGRFYFVKNVGGNCLISGQPGELLFSTQTTGFMNILSGEAYIVANSTNIWQIM